MAARFASQNGLLDVYLSYIFMEGFLSGIKLIAKTLRFLSCLGFVAGRIIFAMIGKFSVMNSFDAIFVFSAELFPTVVR